MRWLISLIMGSRLMRAVGAALAGLAMLFAYGAAKKREGRRETALEAAERYAKTRKDMDDAEGIIGDDPDLARRFLRERAKRDGDL